MNDTQARIVEKIRKYVLENDCQNKPDTYEIKEWKVEELNYGGRITVSIISGMKDDNALARKLCRIHRVVLIGPKGGVIAYGQRGNTGYKGWHKVMTRGYLS